MLSNSVVIVGCVLCCVTVTWRLFMFYLFSVFGCFGVLFGFDVCIAEVGLFAYFVGLFDFV